MILPSGQSVLSTVAKIDRTTEVQFRGVYMLERFVASTLPLDPDDHPLPLVVSFWRDDLTGEIPLVEVTDETPITSTHIAS